MFLILISWLAVVLSSVQLIPQIIKSLQMKETRDISLFTLLIIMAASLSWIIHGVSRNDIAIIVANAIAFVSAATIVILKCIYKK